MECIFIDSLRLEDNRIDVPESEARHLKALRINSGDFLLASNGKGLVCKLLIERIGKNEYRANIIERFPMQGEPKRNITVALGILDDKARFEFALEKSIELGVNKFIPLITEFSSKGKISLERLNQKAIAALKQCKRSMMPIITTPMKANQLADEFSNYDNKILADEFGSKPNPMELEDNILILIGPEGGFSDNEVKLFESSNLTKWALGNRRLRAETALIAGLSILSAYD